VSTRLPAARVGMPPSCHAALPTPLPLPCGVEVQPTVLPLSAPLSEPLSEPLSSTPAGVLHPRYYLLKKGKGSG
jgi:hypothetical protein